MKTLLSTGLVVAVAATFAPPAAAQIDGRNADAGAWRAMQDTNTQGDRYETDRQDFEPVGHMYARIQRVQGQISEMFAVTFLGHDEPHLLARLQHQEGWTVAVDLGPKSQLVKLNLDEGDRVTVVGAPGRINDRAVFFATRVHAKQDMVEVDRSEIIGMMKFRGRIADARRVRYTDVDSEHLVAKIRTDEDRLALVDLGPASNFSDVLLKADTPIQVVATRGTIDDRRAYFAQDARVDEERVTIARPNIDTNMEVASDSPYDPGAEQARAEATAEGTTEEGDSETSGG